MSGECKHAGGLPARHSSAVPASHLSCAVRRGFPVQQVLAGRTLGATLERLSVEFRKFFFGFGITGEQRDVDEGPGLWAPGSGCGFSTREGVRG